MIHNITIFADDDIVHALERQIKAAGSSFAIAHRADSYMDCLEPTIQNKVDVIILQAKSPFTRINDLLLNLQSAGLSLTYILFQLSPSGTVEYAVTSTANNPLAQAVGELFLWALEDTYCCRQRFLTTTVLTDENNADTDAVWRHSCLMELLRGISQHEFLENRRRYNLNLKDNGYYLFCWELMGIEFVDHGINRYIYNFLGSMLRRECYDIIGQFNGGEVFYSTPNLLYIIINDIDLNSEAVKAQQLDEMLHKLTYVTGNLIVRRYMSERVEAIGGLRAAYERYHNEKSLSFFTRDLSVMRPSLIEARKRYTDIKTIGQLLAEITDTMRFDMMNESLEQNLHKLFFEILKPSMSFTLYYSSTDTIYNAMTEILHSYDDIVPLVNNSPNLLQFSSIEEQYSIMLERMQSLRATVNRMKRTKNEMVRRAVNYIAENYTYDISISDISSALYISNVHLSQIFKQEMGMGVIKFVINYRIEQAKKLLRETEDLIYTISENVGFHEFRHFSRTFKKHTGYSPTQYRKQYRVKPEEA